MFGQVGAFDYRNEIPRFGEFGFEKGEVWIKLGGVG